MTEDTSAVITSTATPPEFKLIKAHCYAALATLLISVLFGAIVSIKLHSPDFAGAEPWLTWGRLRYNHTQGIFFGWLGNAFLMFLYYAVPKLAGRPVTNKHLGWWLFAIWNFAVVLPGWALVLAGVSQPLEWAEFPLIVDAFVVLALALMVAQFVVPLLRARLAKLYVSAWYVLGGIVFTLLAYPVGNVTPQLVPGAIGAAFSGLWIHDAIGLWVTPLAVSIAYFVIPAITRKPIYSHFLSMLGFWLLFFVYPLNGTHHYVFSAIPMEAQHVAIAASALLGVDVILVVTNLLLSLRGAKEIVRDDMALRFVRTGTILYLIVSIQGSLQAFMPVNKLVHFSDWVIGHSHLAMLGFATFTAIGGMAYVWRQVPGVQFSNRQLRLSYWHLLSGLIIMVGTLTLSGLSEANIWQTELPWLESVRGASNYWLVRSLSAIPIILGIFFFWRSLHTGDVAVPEHLNSLVDAGEKSPDKSEEKSSTASGASLSMAYASAFIAGVGFFLVSFLALAIIPGMAMQTEVEKTRPATMLSLTPLEEEGKAVYAREGCAYCHTQQVRKVSADVARFGATTRVWETIYDYPQLWGTRRIGPDLARESKVRPDDWQYAHLFNSRLLVPDSVMPGFPWLFDGAPQKPTNEARALVAYMRSLGRERERAGFGKPQVPDYCLCPAEVKTLESTPVAVTASASMARPDAGETGGNAEEQNSMQPVSHPRPEADSSSGASEQGANLFAHNCAGCHGAKGTGDGPAAASLLPQPADLTMRSISAARLDFVMNNGVYGTSMPAWRDLPHREMDSLKQYVSSLALPFRQPQPGEVEALDEKAPPEAPKDDNKILPPEQSKGTHTVHDSANGQISKTDATNAKANIGAKSTDNAAGSKSNTIAASKSTAEIYKQNCASCHGTTGEGNGPAAATIAPRPTNFQLEQPAPAYALRVLAEGIPGTSMPPWKEQLSDRQRLALSIYVRTLHHRQRRAR